MIVLLDKQYDYCRNFLKSSESEIKLLESDGSKYFSKYLHLLEAMPL